MIYGVTYFRLAVCFFIGLALALVIYLAAFAHSPKGQSSAAEKLQNAETAHKLQPASAVQTTGITPQCSLTENVARMQ